MLLVCTVSVLVFLHVGTMVVIVRLENTLLVPVASANTIIIAHDVAQLVKVAEDVDTNASIEPCRLKQPQVLLCMTTLRQPVGSLYRLLFGDLRLLQLLVQHFVVEVYVFLNDFHNLRELLHLFTNVVL